MISRVVGSTGRLGGVIAQTLADRGDTLVESSEVNYLVFAHRYRGEPSYSMEMAANLTDVIDQISTTKWAHGDRAIVLISSIAAEAPDIAQSLAYNISKAALNQFARYYAKVGHTRINTVSPATFTGDAPVVSLQEIANVVAFLCTPQASGIRGQDIRVTGILGCL